MSERQGKVNLLLAFAAIGTMVISAVLGEPGGAIAGFLLWAGCLFRFAND